MKKKSLFIGILFSLILGIISSNFTSMINFTEASNKDIQHGGHVFKTKPQKIEKALKKVPFEVNLPNVNDLPIKVKHKNAETAKISKYDLLEVNYHGENNNLLSLQILNKEIKIMQSSKFEYQTVDLKNNVKAKYIDNGYSQILTWKKDGKGYVLNYFPRLPNENKKIKKATSLEIKELSKVANSLIK